MRTILRLWDIVVASAAVVAFIVIAFGLMIGAVEPCSVWKRIGATLGCAVILIVFPPIVAHLWHLLSLWQQLGMVTLAVCFGTAALRDGSARRRKRGREH